MIVQLMAIAVAIGAVASALCAWLTHEYREAEKRMHDRQGYQPERRKS